MSNNNTTSYTVYAKAVTINYPYMTIFTFHNLGGERFVLFTNQVISLCTSKQNFFFSQCISLSLFFFFWPTVLALLALAQLTNFLFFSLIGYIPLHLPSFCSSYNKNQATRWREHLHFAPKTIPSPHPAVICSPLLHALHPHTLQSTPRVKNLKSVAPSQIQWHPDVTLSCSGSKQK